MKPFAFQICSATLALGWLHTGFAADSGASTNAPRPPLPAIKSLKLQPEVLTLKDGRDERRVLVWGKTEGDKMIDLTSQALLKSDSTNVDIDPQGYVRGKAKGQGEVSVTALGQTAKLTI